MSTVSLPPVSFLTLHSASKTTSFKEEYSVQPPWVSPGVAAPGSLDHLDRLISGLTGTPVFPRLSSGSLFPIPSSSSLHLLAHPCCSSTFFSSPWWHLLRFLYFLLLPEPRQYLLPPAQISIFKGDLFVAPAQTDGTADSVCPERTH